MSQEGHQRTELKADFVGRCTLLPENRVTYYWDTKVAGFALRVGKRKKSWILRYTKNTKRFLITFAEYPHVGLSEARAKASEYRARIRTEKEYPHETLQLKRQRLDEQLRNMESEFSFGEMCERWYSKHALKHRKDPQQARAMLDNDIIPSLGDKPLDQIGKRDVMEALDKIVDRGSPVMANRVGALIREIFGFAVENGYLEINPFPRVNKKMIGGVEKSRERILSIDEIKRFWHGLDDTNIADSTKIALKLLLVTGQRRSEVCALQKSHIDNDIWTIPPELSKNGKKHIVHLSKLATDLITQVTSDAEYLFPNVKDENKPIGEDTVTRAISRAWDKLANEKFTVHDLRRTAASHIASLGYPPYVVEKILNHQLKGVMAVYNREEYLPERREALLAWSDYISDIL